MACRIANFYRNSKCEWYKGAAVVFTAGMTYVGVCSVIGAEIRLRTDNTANPFERHPGVRALNREKSRKVEPGASGMDICYGIVRRGSIVNVRSCIFKDEIPPLRSLPKGTLASVGMTYFSYRKRRRNVKNSCYSGILH